MRAYTEIILLSTFMTAQASCPYGFDESVISDNCYKSTGALVAKIVADNICTRLGSAVIEPRDENDGEYLSTIVQESEKYWLGLTDETTEGEYSWKNGDRLTFTNWAEEEPANSEDADCVVIDATMKWSAVTCDGLHKVLCQADREQRPTTTTTFGRVDFVTDKTTLKLYTATCIEDCVVTCFSITQCDGVYFIDSNKECYQFVHSPGEAPMYSNPGEHYFLL